MCYLETKENLITKTPSWSTKCIFFVYFDYQKISIYAYYCYSSGVISSLGVKFNEITSHLHVYSLDAFQIYIYSFSIKSKNMIREKIASSRQFLNESLKQLGVLEGCWECPSGVKGQSPWKFLGFSVLNTIKLRIVAPIFIQLILIF